MNMNERLSNAIRRGRVRTRFSGEEAVREVGGLRIGRRLNGRAAG